MNFFEISNFTFNAMMSAVLFFSAWMLNSFHTDFFLGLVTYVLKAGNLHVMWLVTFVSEKKLSKHINMGSSLENLDAKSLTVKTDYKSNKQFELQNFLNFRI